MTTAYSNLLGLALPTTGELSGTWGDTVNDYITKYLDDAIANAQIISGSQTAVTLSKTTGTALVSAGSGSTGSAQYALIRCTGNPASTLTITVSYSSLTNAQFSKTYLIFNSTSTNQSVVVQATTSSGTSTGVTIAASERALIGWNGTDFVKIATQNGTGEFVTVDTTNLEVTNIKAKDGTAAASIADSTGAITVSTLLNVDNLRLDGNTISSTDVNGNVVIAPNGTGDVQLDADTVRVGDSNANATITTNGTGDLILNTNSGTNSGSITIEDGVNGNIVIAPNGTGQVQITNAVLDLTTIEVTNIKAKDGTAAIVLTDVTGAVDISTAVTMSATTQNIALGTSQTSGTFTVGGTAQTGTQTFDQSTKTHTLNIGAGATESAATKTINIGTGGVATSTTAVNIGSTNGTTITLNGTVNATTVNVTTLDLTNLEVTNIKAKDGTAAITLADSTGVATFSANPIINAGTANGVPYLNGSKVLTTGSALTFDGTTLNLLGSANDIRSTATGGASFTKLTTDGIYASGTDLYLLAPSGKFISFYADNAEKMRLSGATGGVGALGIGYTSLTSVGDSGLAVLGNVGIGTNAPPTKLYVTVSAASTAVAGFLNTDTANGNGVYIKAGGANAGKYALAIENAAAASLLYLGSTGGLVVTPAAGGTAVFNEGGVDADFRVEGDTDANLLFVDASTDRVGIGTNAPGSKLHVSTSGAGVQDIAWINNSQSVGVGVGSRLVFTGTTNNNGLAAIDGVFAGATTADGGYMVLSTRAATSGTLTERLRITSTGTVNIVGGGTPGSTQAVSFNGSAPQNSLVVDSSGQVGLGTALPSAKLDVAVARSATVTSASFGTTGTGSVNDQNRLLIKNVNTLSGQNYGVGIGGLLEASASNKASLLFYYDSGSASTEGLRLDSSGNLGLGVTPSAWNASYKAFQFGAGSSLAGHTTNTLNFTVLASNQYLDAAGAAIFINNGYAPRYLQRGDTGEHYWYTTNNGSAGGLVTNTQALTLDANRNLLLNGTTAGASSIGTFAIFNGTAPTGSVTDGIILYAEDVSSSSELKVRDEAGNVTTLSPHNFSLIPEGPSEDMAWAYYSEKNGKRINVDMLKLARMVEKLTGEKLVFEA